MEIFSDAYILFENGIFLRGKSFGSRGTKISEAIFNTSMTGYQEIISDPSYAGQAVVFTLTEIGVVGANVQDLESDFSCDGIFVAEYNDFFSNFRAQESLHDFLRRKNIFGISHVNTRKIVAMLRDFGAMKVAVSTEISCEKTLQNLLKNHKMDTISLVRGASITQPQAHENGIFDFDMMNFPLKTALDPEKQPKILVIDCGVKQNILNELRSVGLRIEVTPYDFDAKKVISRVKNGEISGIFLSNGPGDPADLRDLIEKVRLFIAEKIPMFGICLGHQIFALAHGYPTQKLKFGHHGGNHPVKNLSTGEILITAQNHNFVVPESIEAIAKITHRDLFDGVIEGLEYKNAPIFSIQYHPEASPGPHEGTSVFQKFAKMLRDF